jgi:hypothetical protein
MKKVAAVILLLVGCAGVLIGKPKDQAPCKVSFVMVEQDEMTGNLTMVGLNKQQSRWYKKEGNQKDYAGVCTVDANESGEQTALESGSEEYINRTVGDSPLYLVAWEEHRVFVPDTKGGHYAYSATGTLSKWRSDNTNPDGGSFVPVGPVHNTNRTILSSSGDSDDVDQSFRSDADQSGAKRRRTLSV